MGSGVSPAEITSIKSLSCYNNKIKQTKNGHPQAFLDLFLGGCCIALRKVDFADGRRSSCLQSHCPDFSCRNSAVNCSLAGPGKLPSLSRWAQIPLSAHLSPNSFSWICSTCPRTCTMGKRDYFFFFSSLSLAERKKKYPPGSSAWPEQSPRCAEPQSLEAGGGGRQGGKIRHRAKEF